MKSNYDNYDAMSDRAIRALEVKRDYVIEQTSDESFVVMNPDETERCYLVDLVQETCTCPDFWGYCKDRDIECKHIQACRDMSGKKIRKAYLLSDGTIKEKRSAKKYIPPQSDLEAFRENVRKQHLIDDDFDPYGD